MKKFKYFIQAIIIFLFFFIFKIIGLNISRKISSKIMQKLGAFFRSKEVIEKNFSYALPNLSLEEKNMIINNMWSSYGKILAEYIFIKKYRFSKNNSRIQVIGQDIINEIKSNNEKVIFFSGHFDNFELMAMYLEKSGLDITAVYRPLNNIFLNPFMEKIRTRYICKKQVKKGLAGTKQILKNFKNGSSIALMIDQRVSQGIRNDFFGKKALTTTIPAQFVKKFKCRTVPIYIERDKNNNFKIEIFDPISFSNNETIETITSKLNKKLEGMILHNPNQWIWTHNRWK